VVDSILKKLGVFIPIFLISTILILSITFSLISTIPVKAQPTEDYYIVIERDPTKLVMITASGVRTEIFSYTDDTYPSDVVIDSEGNYIIAELDEFLVKITPLGVRTIIRSFPSTTAPNDVAIDSDGNYIVCESYANKLTKISSDGSTRTILFSFSPGTYPFDVVIDSDGNYIVAEKDSDTLTKITNPGGSRIPIYTYPGDPRPCSVAIDSNGDYIVCEMLARKLAKISSDGSTRTEIYTFTGSPYDVVIDSEGNYIVCESVHFSGYLHKITPAGDSDVIYTFEDDTYPRGVAYVAGTAGHPVGGIIAPVNKLGILTPYIALVGLIGAVSTIFAIRRWRKD